MINYADVVVDLQAGDTGKGKVTHSLLKNSEYTHVVRYNGGGNAGHTIYHNNQKIVTHFIPCGVLYGIKSIIGPGCVIHPIKLQEEITYLESFGFDVKLNLYIDKRVHIITEESIEEDSKDTTIGTTKTGNGPTYMKKYGRTGIRAEDYYSDDSIIDIYEEFHGDKSVRILFEGAQGFELDIDWGDYPYVTSSHCTVGSAILNGVPPQSVRNIYGIGKAYRTYVGNKKFEGDDEVFEKIREIGNEYGATTGRKRQVGWLDIRELIKAININGVTDLIINKVDVLEETGVFKYINHDKTIRKCDTIMEFKFLIDYYVRSACPTIKKVTFSGTHLDI